MEFYTMSDIIPLLPIPAPPQGRISYNLPCPCCDRPERKKDRHLNIHLQKNVFRCSKCGWNGGVLDLYAQFSHTPRHMARDALLHIFNGSADSVKAKPTVRRPATRMDSPPVPDETPLVDVDVRHQTYSAFLSMLSLAPDHRQNLAARGLSVDAVEKGGYRTTPVAGSRIFAKQLLDAGCRLEGVPGFYIDKAGQWTAIAMRRGLLVPVRDPQGRIQGIQVRLDRQDRRKYRWLSSVGATGGCGAESWAHLAGPPMEAIILTEGPLKADVVHCLTGQTVLAVPGVNALRHLEAALVELVGLGVRQVMTAFDMDFLQNPHVRNGYAELVGLLGRMEFGFGTYLWDPGFKGLDDFVLARCRVRND